MATAELAIALPVLALVATVALSALACAVDTIRCVDAARATARLLARGDPPESALEQGRALAPRGAAIDVTDTPGTVEVRVVASPPGALGWLGVLGAAVVPAGEAVAALEDVAPAGPAR
jgi:hypothetical protein